MITYILNKLIFYNSILNIVLGTIYILSMAIISAILTTYFSKN